MTNPIDSAPVPMGGKKKGEPEPPSSPAAPASTKTQPATSKPTRKGTSWAAYADLIAATMTRVLGRPITPWTIAGPRSQLAQAMITHGRVDGQKLTGEAFRVWLVGSIEKWLAWHKAVEDRTDLPRELYVARQKGLTGYGWVAWLDGGGPCAPERPALGAEAGPRKVPAGYQPPRLT